MERSKITIERNEHKGLKVEKFRESQPPGSGGEEPPTNPSKSVKKVSWYEMTL